MRPQCRLETSDTNYPGTRHPIPELNTHVHRYESQKLRKAVYNPLDNYYNVHLTL